MARKVGDVVAIPISNERFAFGRRLVDTVEFFDYCHPEADADLDEIFRWKRLFAVLIMGSAFGRRSSWRVIGNRPLTEAERNERFEFRKQDPITGDLQRYWSNSDLGTWESAPATREAVEGLEAAAVWSASHVEDRLRDHFEGRTNPWVETLRLK